jgi:hypothetical protein
MPTATAKRRMNQKRLAERKAAEAKSVQGSLDPQENESTFAEYVVFEKKHDLKEFADSDSMRFALSGIRYDSENHEFVATDSRMLAIVPADGKRLEKDLILPASTMRKVRSLVKGESEVRIRPVQNNERRVSLSCGETTVETGVVEGRFPKYREVLPNPDDAKLTVIITASLLLRLTTHAVRSFGNDVRLHCRMYDAESQVLIHAVRDGEPVATYVVMPCSPPV